jgi:hypothetical protein
MTAAPKAALAKLREPFPASQVGKLPKPYNKDSAKGNCKECGGYHGLPALHLDYVGHAALTDRFLDVDPEWFWQPVAFDPAGLPAFDKNGGLWITLTICGVTRLGYGDAQGKTGPNAVKEAIGDALRNAGMRFGAALDLWHKGDLHDEQAADEPAFDTTEWEAAIAAATTTDELARVGTKLQGTQMPDAARSVLRSEYARRLTELAGEVAA